MVDRKFWNKKRVFLTGHTGFKGGWLASWLLDMNSDVFGYALKPDTKPSYFALCGLADRMHSVIGDIRDRGPLKRALHKAKPEIVIHMAAQPLVRRSYREPIETFATNVMGTVHLLDEVRRMPSVRAVVVVTSDKCYENKEWARGYREDDSMGGYDPYSASKGCAELVAAAYRRSFFGNAGHPAQIATARAGNVIGGGDWSEDRLLPDTVRAFELGKPLVIRNPKSVRPWQHVLDPLSGYLMLAERLFKDKEKWTGAWNFGPSDDDAVTVATVAEMIMRQWGKGAWKEARQQQSVHEARYLKLDCSKARQELGWRPLLSLDQAIEMSVAWYRKALSGGRDRDMYQTTCEQIRSYESRWRL